MTRGAEVKWHARAHYREDTLPGDFSTVLLLGPTNSRIHTEACARLSFIRGKTWALLRESSDAASAWCSPRSP